MRAYSYRPTMKFHGWLKYASFTCAVVLFAVLLFSVSGGSTARAETIHEEKSLYQNITVTEDSERRCLVFSANRRNRNQTCMDIRDPDRLVFHYTRMSLAGLLLNPEPERILIAGLGGGTIPMVLSQLYPDASIDVLEIDAAVVSVAQEFFGFSETDNMEAHVADARVFIKRAGLSGEKYDFIMLDAFTGEYIPEHLLTREFLQEVREILTEDGVLVANTFSTSRLYAHESVTYLEVFPELFNFKLPNTGNRVIITQKQDLPSAGALSLVARELSEALKPFGVNILEYPSRLTTRPDWDESARVLTDQYSPANLLR